MTKKYIFFKNMIFVCVNLRFKQWLKTNWHCWLRCLNIHRFQDVWLTVAHLLHTIWLVKITAGFVSHYAGGSPWYQRIDFVSTSRLGPSKICQFTIPGNGVAIKEGSQTRVAIRLIPFPRKSMLKFLLSRVARLVCCLCSSCWGCRQGWF